MPKPITTDNILIKDKEKPVNLPEKPKSIKSKPVSPIAKNPIKAREFVNAYMSNGKNATRAYMAVNSGVKLNSAGTAGSRLLKSNEVKGMLGMFESEAEGKLISLMRNDDHPKQFDALKLTLAYTKGNPVSRSENLNVTITVESVLLDK